MQLRTAFDQFQTAVNADPEDVGTARERRDLFLEALLSDPEVVEAFAIGSLARRTQLDPIKDVDIVAVFDGSSHTDWGQAGESAGQSLRYAGARVNALLGITNGSFAKAVRLAKPRNHAVKCFLDEPDDPDAFTVDVVPALRRVDGTLLIPECLSEKWIPADPEHLINEVRSRQSGWNQLVPLVRVLKHWNSKVARAGLKSLAVEVLALECLPDEYVTEESDSAPDLRPEALSRFFASAVVRIDAPLEDPAGHCGLIQPDLDVDAVREALQMASDEAFSARAAAGRGDIDGALCHWRAIFGEQFPEPPRGCEAVRSAAEAISGPRLIRDVPQGA